MTEDLTVHDPDTLAIVEERYSDERRQAVAKFLGIEPTEPALMPYLALCQKWNLDPFLGQVWLIEQKGKNGKPGRLRPAIGRDGYLAVAQRQPSFEGLTSAVVCERDEFDVFYDGTKDEPKVVHRYRSKPTEFGDDEDSYKYRGEIVGAWAKLRIKGRYPVFFFAPTKEYVKIGTSQDGTAYYQGAWKYLSSMLLKVAESRVLRIGYGVTGAVPADEFGDREDSRVEAEVIQATGDGTGPALEVIEDATPKLDELGDDDLVKRLRSAIEVSNREEPFSWAAPKLQMKLSSVDSVEALEALVVEVETDAEKIIAAATQEAEVVEGEVQEPDEVEAS